MASCKELRREHKTAAREEKALRAQVRAANARVVEATKKLPPLYVETADAARAREAVKPLVAEAQAISNRWWHAADRLTNANAAVAGSCAKASK